MFSSSPGRTSLTQSSHNKCGKGFARSTQQVILTMAPPGIMVFFFSIWIMMTTMLDVFVSSQGRFDCFGSTVFQKPVCPSIYKHFLKNCRTARDDDVKFCCCPELDPSNLYRLTWQYTMKQTEAGVSCQWSLQHGIRCFLLPELAEMQINSPQIKIVARNEVRLCRLIYFSKRQCCLFNDVHA